jgi:predicted metal-dependent hydrolase
MQLLKRLNLNLNIQYKPIKNLYLRILPPEGKISICAPLHTPLDVIKKFVHLKSAWIESKQKKLQNCKTYQDLQIFGKPVEIIQISTTAPINSFLKDEQMIIQIPKTDSKEAEARLLHHFYKKLLLEKCQQLIAKWEPKLAVKVKKLSIRSMKTRWGSCTPKTAAIRINLKLLHFEEKYLEYIVVHELAHLLEASHNQRFKKIMSHHLPEWKLLQQQLHFLSIQ